MKEISKKENVLKILYLEDNSNDAELIQETVNTSIQAKWTLVDTKDAFISALKTNEFDIILSDYKLQTFEGPLALDLAKEFCPDTPIIFVSGTVGEEKAVELLKQGATDYVLKDRTGRLASAINRALKEAEEEKKLKKTQEDLKQHNEALKIAKNKAEESDRLKSAFLANISHEIRTPMNGIVGFTDLLVNNHLVSDEAKHYVEIIQNSCNQLITIITNIIEMSIIESNNVTINITPIDINTVFAYTYSIFESPCNNKKLILLRKDIEFEHMNFKSDSAKLTQILNNLISNSIKFTHHGYIEYGATKKENFIEFYVKDTGIGIEADNFNMIFERFRQVEIGNTRNYGGNGLGLSISKSLIETMGGKIWVESKLGEGSTFKFTLPYEPCDIDDNSNENKQDAEIHLTDLNILVAEDEDCNFLYLKEILTKKGASVKHATNGKEAIELCQKNNSLDLIVMDIRMPVIDGLTAIKEIKKFSSTPIIAVTAYTLQNEKREIINTGCDAYIPKPVNETALLNTIKNLTKSNNSVSTNRNYNGSK